MCECLCVRRSRPRCESYIQMSWFGLVWSVLLDSDWLATFVLLLLSRQSKLYPLTGRSAASSAVDVDVNGESKVKVKVNPSAKIQYFMH